MITEWLLSLPIWGAMIWFFGGAVFYSLGINLARAKRNMGYLPLSLVGIITTYTTMIAINQDIIKEPAFQVIPIIIIFVLILLGIKWANLSKPKGAREHNKIASG